MWCPPQHARQSSGKSPTLLQHAQLPSRTAPEQGEGYRYCLTWQLAQPGLQSFDRFLTLLHNNRALFGIEPNYDKHYQCYLMCWPLADLLTQF